MSFFLVNSSSEPSESFKSSELSELSELSESSELSDSSEFFESSSSSSLFFSLTLFSSLTSSAALFSSGWVAWSTSGSLGMSLTSSGTSSGWVSTCSALSKYRLAQRYFLLILTENKSNEILEFYRKYLNSTDFYQLKLKTMNF